MFELDLRVSLELHERIELACARNKLKLARFCRCAVRQWCSGKVSALHNELLECTTYNGKKIQIRKWGFDINEDELRKIFVYALIKLEKAKAIKLPKVKEAEGVDCNIPVGAELLKIKDGAFDLPESVRESFKEKI